MSFIGANFTVNALRPPRAKGALHLSSKVLGNGSAIDTLRTSGSTKALFPHGRALEAIMINTSGGLTGGDAFVADVKAGAGTEITLTTQAAERAYRSAQGAAMVETRLSAQEDATLFWLPQELIVFDGAGLNRRLTVDLAQTSHLLMVEQIVFGRTAMGERVGQISLDDRIEIRRGNSPIYLDRIFIDGNAEDQLSGSAVARDKRAVATVVSVHPNAETQLQTVRRMLPQTAGASLLAPDILVLRLLAKDGYLMRCALVPVLELLKGGALPRSWSL
ncbi:MAG: urease accessory protein UreD [Silicimonas sp.]|nr:urease accessory protein UreD [Silicimonas sp.]